MKREIEIKLKFNEKEAEELVREITLIEGDKNFQYLNIEFLLELKEDLVWNKALQDQNRMETQKEKLLKTLEIQFQNDVIDWNTYSCVKGWLEETYV